MIAKKHGLPEESELVLCTVTNVQSHSVFVNMDEYGLTGMIHISEVSPGRIRNIRDFVKEGKVIVCKVLRVNQERRHVDLSFRRVTESQRRGKLNEVKQELLIAKIVEFAAKSLNLEAGKLYAEVSEKALKDYPSLHACFSDVVEKDFSLEKLSLGKAIAKELESIIRQRIKPVEAELKGVLTMTSFAADGIGEVKKAAKKVMDAGISIKYLGAGKYLLAAKAKNFKDAEKALSNAANAAIKVIQATGEGSFSR